MKTTDSRAEFTQRSTIGADRWVSLCTILGLICLGLAGSCGGAAAATVGEPTPGLTKASQDRFAIGTGLASAMQSKPAHLEFWSDSGQISATNARYSSWTKVKRGFLGQVTVGGPGGSCFAVEDRWTQDGEVLRLVRQVKVAGNAPGGFLSGVTFDFVRASSWSEADWFVPGMIYGGFASLADTAIGGRAHYRAGEFTVRIREDRMPAPMVLAHFGDGTSFAVLDPRPRGDTTAADSLDTKAVPMVDERFQFGAIGAQEHEGKLSIGHWFPGTEGEVTYAGNTYPGGQLHLWRRRYHPIKDGLIQNYEVAFRFAGNESFPQSYSTAWRWAWETLKPAVMPQDIATARASIVGVLARCTIEKDGRTGIPNYLDSVSKDLTRADDKAVMGFTGKNLEAAHYMLAEAAMGAGPRSEELRRKGEAIIASFLRLKMAPPEGEGFSLKDGHPVCALGDNTIYLRSFGDDIKALLRAYQLEKKWGRNHPEWLQWCRTFGDWLLTQQQPAGGFPRSWRPGTGEVLSASPNSSFNAIPLLVQLSQLTGDGTYLSGATRAADFCWANGQDQGKFVGGTIDNPDVLDKEAATLSLEAYLALYETTRNAKWLARAQAAANYAETWIYCWNVPMPPDDDDTKLHWKRGVSTVGVQLIASGHSLVDDYMSFDADEFAKLYEYTGDAHYLAVARILLHNTKSMLALPGRQFDLGEPGWQQEHWSLAPRRGYGLHRGWLPWVATSQLNGIFGVLELEPSLRNQILNPNTPR